MAPGNDIFYSVTRKPGRLLEYSYFTPACGLCRSEPCISLADRGNNMERNDINKSMCEGLFGRKLK